MVPFENVVEITECVYTKTIILLNLGATIHLDFKE